MPWGCCRGSFSPPWKAHPAPASLPRSQAGGRKAGACGRSPGTHTHHSSLLSAPLPAPTPPSRPHSRPPRCLTPGWLMALQVPAGMDGCYPRLLLKEPISAELPLCLSLPSLPAAKRGCWKTENGGARWEMQGSASSPAAGAEVPLGRSVGRSRSTGEGREGRDGQGCVGRVGQMPRHPPPQILPILCCSIPAGNPWRAQSHCAGSELPPPPQHPPGWDQESNREVLPIPSRMSYSGIIPAHVMSEGHEQKILQSLGIFH